MSKFRILFLGTPDIAVPCLEALIRSPEFEVVGVVTQPDRPAGRHMKLQACPVELKAVEHGIEVLSPETVKTREAHQWIRDRNPDSAVVVAFGQILPQSFLDLFPKKSVNVHASLLPRWRGAAPIQRAIMEGDLETGVSLQEVVLKLDAGPVLGLRKLKLDDSIHSLQLYEWMKIHAPELLRDEYLRYLKGELKPTAQDEGQVTLAAKIKKEDGLIQWNMSAVEIHRRLRGLWMWPGSWTIRQGKILKLWDSKVGGRSGSPGQVIRVTPNSLEVACREGSLEVFDVQPESRARMKVSEYLKGYPIEEGEVLGK